MGVNLDLDIDLITETITLSGLNAKKNVVNLARNII